MNDADVFVPVEPRWWLSNFGGMVAFGVVAARSQSLLVRRGFAAAAALHVAEAVYAYGAARRAGYVMSANRWALQTLAVGFPSLLALRAATTEQAPEELRGQ
jgi:hypothetical protein